MLRLNSPVSFKRNAVHSFPSSELFQPIALPAEVDSSRVFRILESAYENEIKEEERCFLAELEREWQLTKPFKGRKILINAHMTLITLVQIKLFIKAGAEVEVTATRELVTHEDAIRAIARANILFYGNGDIPLEKRTGYYDIVYDCGAGMLKTVVPKEGMVELTHTDPALYTDIQFPVITVDTSQTKCLETGFGTGDAAVRVVKKLYEISLMSLLSRFVTLSASGTSFFSSVEDQQEFINVLTLVDMTKWLREKYLIFGYGKVGKGIATALKYAGIPQKSIYIVDVSADVYMRVQEDGFNGIHLVLQSNGCATSTAKAKVLEAINCVSVVITATGVAGAVSRFFDLHDFSRVAFLINMGTPDEFGNKFPVTRIVNHKKPANFMLDRPTEVRYLDPIFWIWANGGYELISNTSLSKGLNNMNKNIDRVILGKWMNKHPDIWGKLEKEGELVTLLLKFASGEAEQSSFFDLYQRFGVIRNNDSRVAHLLCPIVSARSRSSTPTSVTKLLSPPETPERITAPMR